MRANDPFLLEPTPYDEATAFIAGKPVVSREIFDKLLPELRARAFVISGVESADVVQGIRDRIAELPQGGDWEKIKQGIVEDLGPWFNETAAKRRAELLMRMHGFQAYRSGQYQLIQETKAALPYLRYIATNDARTRPDHAALHGVILPVDDPFWDGHMPPWDWGCRCQVVQLSEYEVELERELDAKRPPDRRLVLDETARSQLHAGRLVRGPSEVYDIRTPEERGGSGPGSPQDLRIPLEALKGRYDAQTWNDFQQWGEKQKLDDGRTVMQWLRGEEATPAPPPPPAPKKKAAQRKPKAPPPVSGEEPKSLDELLTQQGIPNEGATAEHMAALKRGLRKSDPATRDESIIKIRGGSDALSKANIEKVVDEFFAMVPKSVADDLPPFEIKLTAKQGIRGEYGWGELKIAKHLATDPTQARRTLFHEMGHWLHLYRKDQYPKQIMAHFNERTAGEAIATLPGFGRGTKGKRDNWYKVYAGRIYGTSDERTHLGSEVPTTYIELLTLPEEQLAKYWNHPAHGETLRIVLGGFFKQ